ncbi:hypothetical protein STAS_15017 [Striga asiatica]|uniref:Uncharacterized protein n=1 Tax=Striga asiatica TaxID=4170 RepID=A0A5A7Q043_STRAF|nr:hypothetical protein STAS_15017 [Striga asiatica]
MMRALVEQIFRLRISTVIEKRLENVPAQQKADSFVSSSDEEGPWPLRVSSPSKASESNSYTSTAKVSAEPSAPTEPIACTRLSFSTDSKTRLSKHLKAHHRHQSPFPPFSQNKARPYRPHSPHNALLSKSSTSLYREHNPFPPSNQELQKLPRTF